MKLDPANHDAFAEAGIKMAAASNLEEGVISYAFWAGLEDKGTFRVFEEYVDDDAVASHFASPHMAEFMGALGSVGITEADVQKYVVSEKSKLM